eukprot:c4399_g1_i1.p1 GENE.c4399_g1_i1~~c4399_g1_i1.p1  ORF type:complete len:371 (+),score=148.07 c4399_g1_i1:91-1113(+)
MYFPSKVGGKPAWLNPEILPNVADLTCANCQNRLNFLLQLYAPLENKETTFHRTLFIFCCFNGQCHSFPGSIRVFRSQLPKINKYYPASPPKFEDDPDASNEETIDEQEDDPFLAGKLCQVCGQPASQQCSQCRKVRYCCKQHQQFDWKERHKLECPKLKQGEKSEKRIILEGTQYVYKQWEIIVEEDSTDNTKKGEVSDIQREMKEMEKHQNTELTDITGEDLDEIDKMQKVDKQFLKFQKRIKQHPDQVLRYSITREDAAVLWISSQNQINNVPPCEHCGKERVFEMQITPQLIHYLEQDELLDTAIDFGTLVIFTCKDSCDAEGVGYFPEFIWRQMP